MLHHIEPQRFEVRTILASSDTAVIHGDLASLVKAAGKLIESEFAFDLTVRNGLPVRYRKLKNNYAVERTNPLLLTRSVAYRAAKFRLPHSHRGVSALLSEAPSGVTE